MARLFLTILLALVVPSHEIYNVEDDVTSVKPAPVTQAPSSGNKPQQFKPGIGVAFFGREEDINAADSSTWNNQVYACGNSSVLEDDTVSLIIDGTPAQEGQWPWHAAIYLIESVNLNYKCGGTLVTHQSVITAAHCTTYQRADPVRLFDVDKYTIFLGRLNLGSANRGMQIKYVESVVVHPDFNAKTLYHDLSIIKLDEPARFTRLVNPVCLWQEETKDVSNVVGKLGTVIGFGVGGTGELKQLNMPVIDDLTCIRSKPEFYGKKLSSTSNSFCAGRNDGGSPCNGDSGGGIFFNVSGFSYLRGLVSIGPKNPGGLYCDPTQYVIFTDVAQFLPWIRSHLVGQ